MPQQATRRRTGHPRAIQRPMNIAELEKRVLEGSVGAMTILGSLYLDGLGVTQDYARAFELLTAAASHRAPRALLNLGRMHADGLGIALDVERASALYLDAAERGEFLACVYYARHCVVAQDAEGALQWYAEAAAQQERVREGAELEEALAYVSRHG
jgi:uncharacterized protein